MVPALHLTIYLISGMVNNISNQTGQSILKSRRMKNGKTSLRLFIYATYISESARSFPGIQLIFAKLSLTEALTFNTVGADGREAARERDKEGVSG